MVLGNGKIWETGFNPNKLSPLSGGMRLHSLLFQSNMGVVVEGILRLRLAQEKNYFLVGFKSFEGFTRSFSQLRNSQLETRLLRWYDHRSFAQSPAATIGPKALRTAAGVLAVETSAAVAIANLRKACDGIVFPVSRELLIASPPLRAVQAMVLEGPFSFFSFSVRNSKTALLNAQRWIDRNLANENVEIHQTISFLQDAAIFLLRVVAPPNWSSAKCKKLFMKIASDIKAAGYDLYRRHSGIEFRQTSDSQIKRQIKAIFDPKGIIAPGRYGL